MRRRQPPSSTLFRLPELARLSSMLLLLALIWMLYQRAGDVDTWRWFANTSESDTSESDTSESDTSESDAFTGNPELLVRATIGKLPSLAMPSEVALPSEVVVPGPGADDPEEQDAAREEFQALSDRTPLDALEMPSYWRLMRWSRTQRFAALERVADRNVLFTQLWEQPEKYRGKPIRLRLHIKRALVHEAPVNSAEIKQVYEAWGWTEESKSFPYLVVFSDLPPNMPLGPDIQEEAVFVGYFLKLMSYQAFDTQRATPLLIGRLQRQSNAMPNLVKEDGAKYFWPTLAGGVVLLGITIFSWYLKARTRRHRGGQQRSGQQRSGQQRSGQQFSALEEANANAWLAEAQTGLESPNESPHAAPLDFENR